MSTLSTNHRENRCEVPPGFWKVAVIAVVALHANYLRKDQLFLQIMAINCILVWMVADHKVQSRFHPTSARSANKWRCRAKHRIWKSNWELSERDVSEWGPWITSKFRLHCCRCIGAWITNCRCREIFKCGIISKSWFHSCRCIGAWITNCKSREIFKSWFPCWSRGGCVNS